jgi:hypothetical protein
VGLVNGKTNGTSRLLSDVLQQWTRESEHHGFCWARVFHAVTLSSEYKLRSPHNLQSSKMIHIYSFRKSNIPSACLIFCIRISYIASAHHPQVRHTIRMPYPYHPQVKYSIRAPSASQIYHPHALSLPSAYHI